MPADTQDVSSLPKRRFIGEQQVRSHYIDISKTLLMERARAGLIPGVARIGRRVLFDVEQLEAWLKAGGDQIDESPNAS